MRRTRGDGESGFALLFVFALAAIVALMLYLEMPRVAFEAQRAKEDLLIQRGEQYKRAIKLFVRRFNRYPGSIEQLENTNNIRFLRKRYTDPMTGKNEWRFIHSVGGVFPDSLTQKAPAIKGAVDVSQLAGDSSGGDSSGGSNPAPPPVGWRRLRGGQRTGAVQLASPPGADTGSQDTDYPPLATPSGEPDASGNQPDQQTYPGQPPPPGQGFPGQPAVPGEATPGQVLPPGQLFPGQPLPRGQAFPGQLPYAQQPLTPQQQGQDVGGGINVTGSLANPVPAGANNVALGAIMSQLTGGAPSAFPGNSNIGAGIAGVASKSEGEGIKIYNDHTKYKEWEFIYDPRKDITIVPAFPAVPPVSAGSAGTGGAPGTIKPGAGQN